MLVQRAILSKTYPFVQAYGDAYGQGKQGYKLKKKPQQILVVDEVSNNFQRSFLNVGCPEAGGLKKSVGTVNIAKFELLLHA
ncbi:hypothetical protein AAVH_16615 [Aphelenchoides avenae]|nr:hypothetical protein AAVH_16615 [Aphelenchus avenae]